MVKVSIICLIYKSTKLADWVYKSALKYTPMLQNGEAEFLFVANDPTDAVIKHLMDNNYPFIINKNDILTDEEMFAKGYGKPEYMRRVYRGYNQGILHAKGERIVLINSDNYFSPDWLENLLKYSTFKTVVCSQIVEPGHEKFSFFPSALRANFGKTSETFNEDDFIAYTYKVKLTGLAKGGAYMPCMLYKEAALYAGLYPEGNIAGDNFDTVIRYGDEFFYDNLARLGIQHYTSKDSISYHLKEGERDAPKDDDVSLEPKVYKKFLAEPMNELLAVAQRGLNVHLEPSANHAQVVKKLLNIKIVQPKKKGFLSKIIKEKRSEGKTAYKFLGIPFFKEKYTENTRKYYLFGIKIYKSKNK